MFRTVALAALVAILAVALVAAMVGALFGVGTPGTPRPDSTSPSAPSAQQNPTDPDETFYVAAYHWDYAIFREDGSQLDTITVPQGTTIQIFAVNVLAERAVDKLPAPVAEAIRGLPAPKAEAIIAMEPGPPEPLWPVQDHGFLIPWYRVTVYLAADAEQPRRVVFTADRPGEYEFVCTNYCGAGHIAMWPVRLIVQP